MKKFLSTLFLNVLAGLIVNTVSFFCFQSNNNTLSSINNSVVTTDKVTTNTEVLSYSEIMDKYTETITPDFQPTSFVEKYKYGLFAIFRPSLLPISFSELGFSKFVAAVFFYISFIILIIFGISYFYYILYYLIYKIIPHKICQNNVYQKIELIVMSIFIILIPFLITITFF